MNMDSSSPPEDNNVEAIHVEDVTVEDTADGNTYNVCTKHYRQLMLAATVITMLVGLFDLTTDWITFVAFYRYRNWDIDTHLSIALATASACGSIVFFIEVRNIVKAAKIYNKKHKVKAEEEISLRYWEEGTSYTLLLLEDAPVSIVMYVTFFFGSCELVINIFDQTIVGNLAMLGAFISACWKMILAFRYCCCTCCGRKKPKKKNNNNKPKNTGHVYCFCVVRVFRCILAAMVVTFVAYLYFTFEYQGMELRENCYNVTQAASDSDLKNSSRAI